MLEIAEKRLQNRQILRSLGKDYFFNIMFVSLFMLLVTADLG
jgi:hypothetical protein